MQIGRRSRRASGVALSAVAALGLACGENGSTASRDVATGPWEPTKTVQLIVPAGAGGGADQMARTLQSIIASSELMDESLVVINKAGGAGAEGFLGVKGAEGDAHTIIITLSNLFTTPLATGVPFRWTDLTPVSMLALDQFVLWVNAESPVESVADFRAALGGPQALKMAGTGSKQEDQIIAAAIEQATGAKITYVPMRGGGDVAVQLVGGHVDATANNPVEAVAQWRAGALRPLCVFAGERMPYTEPIAGERSWSDIPTCAEEGLPVQYQMLRGIFLPPGVSAPQVDYYADLFERVRATPEWQAFVDKAAFEPTALSGAEFRAWLEREDERHVELMTAAGFLADAAPVSSQ